MLKITLNRAIVQDLYAEAQTSDNTPVSGSIIKQGNDFALASTAHANCFAAYYSEIDSNDAPSPDHTLFTSSPERLILVISLQTKGVLELSGYQKTDAGVEKVELSII